MEKTLNSRDLKRIDSDNKILRAAISEIGKKGYTASSIRDIAKEAGVTPGLIMQRFESKENLVLQALYITNKVWRDLYIPEDMTAYDMLTRIVYDAKNMYETDREGFEFIYMMSISTDAPSNFQALQKEIFYERGMHRTLKRAQDAGNLPDGDLAVLFNIFVCNALRLIRDYKRSGLKMPKDENFLSLMQYRDLVAEEQQFYRNKAFESIVQSFFNLIYFNVNTGKFRIAKAVEELEKYSENFCDGQELLNSACKDTVDIKFQDAVMKFVDLSTVIDRIGDKKVIAEDYIGLDKCTYRISFISVLREPGNEVVLCGVQKIKDNI